MAKIITDNDPEIITALESLERIESLISSRSLERISLNGEIYLTNNEASKLLKTSRRTLQEYRNNKILPYYRLGGRILYRESDITKMLEDVRIEMRKSGVR